MIQKTYDRLLFSILVFTLLLGGCIKDPVPNLLQTMRPELVPDGTISGQLFDFQGNPIISVLAVTDKGYTGISRNGGAFIIENLPAGTHDIFFIRYGYLDSLIVVKDLGINDDRFLGTVLLRDGLSHVHGQVLSSKGTPVPNATVVLSEHPYSTRTDAQGRFSIERLSPEFRRIMAAQEDEGWGQELLSLSPGANCEINIHLHSTKTGTVRGMVYNKNNEPDSGAIVTSFGGMFKDTAEDGSFSLQNLPCTMPLFISSGPTHMVSGILIPENDPLVSINLSELRVISSGDISIVERQLSVLQDDSVIISADVRTLNGTVANYDSAAVFLWKTKNNEAPFDTSTSSPLLQVQHTPGVQYQYGIITVGGDTLMGVPVTLTGIASRSEIRFVDSSFSPVDTSITLSDSVRLMWNAFDLDGRPLEYSVYFGGYSTSPPSLYKSGITDTFLVVKPPNGWLERKYRWQVEARSSKGSIKSSEFIFSIL